MAKNGSAAKWKIDPIVDGDKLIYINADGIDVMVDFDDVEPRQAKRVAKFIAAVSPLFSTFKACTNLDNMIEARYEELDKQNRGGRDN